MIICAFMAVSIFEIIDLSIQVQQYYSGWLMILLLIVLLSFYAKKKLSILPVGSSSTWAQLHYYTGLFLLIIYLKHIELSLPSGIIEKSINC